MTRASKIIIALSVTSTLFFGALLLSLQPVPLPTSENTVRVEGMVKSIQTDPQTHDVIFEIEGNGDTYHVNQGPQTAWQSIDTEDLLNEQVSLYYVRTSNPFEAVAGIHHVSRIEMSDQVLFDEMGSFTSIDLAVSGEVY